LVVRKVENFTLKFSGQYPKKSCYTWRYQKIWNPRRLFVAMATI